MNSPLPGALERDRDLLESQIEAMETGKMKTGENHGHGWVDTTEKDLAWFRELKSLLDEILTTYE